MIKLPPIDNVTGRKAWAFVVLFGAAIVFTVMIVFALWQLRENADFTFWLALAAHAQLAIVMTAFSWTLGRRAKIAFSRTSVEIDDREGVATVTKTVAPAAERTAAPGAGPDPEIEEWD